MGSGIGTLNRCFAGDAGEISRRRNDIAVCLSDPLDEGFGHSFCYIRPELSYRAHSDDYTSTSSATTTTFRTISGASISANTSTPLSTALIDVYSYDFYPDKASAFESSESFASIPLQPIPRNSIPSVRSGPIPPTSGVVLGSGPIERGFLSGPIERSFISGPLENQYDMFQRYRPKSKKRTLMRILKKAVPKSIGFSKELNWVSKKFENGTANGENAQNPTTQLSFSCEKNGYDDEMELFPNRNVQWAQGKAGEDRVHVVVSEEYGWVFVGIYDGFNGPDATDYLQSNLYSNVCKELKDSLDNIEFDQKQQIRGDHQTVDSQSESIIDQDNYPLRVLTALSEALRKTETAYLEIANMMVTENPELSLMGSCVLAMLMKGEDVFLVNVGDSRALLAQKIENDLSTGIGKTSKDSNRTIDGETVNEVEASNCDEFDISQHLSCHQLTVDHCTSMAEEVDRIKREHPDDASAIVNDRVKGSLNVTRAFGAGFLKQPNLNNALLEVFRIDYVGNSPYINCFPSLHHHRLGPRDRFLILSSDGLYQYFTNEEAVFEVGMFMASFPEGDPAQHLIEVVLFRAAKRAGMDFHELLDIPQGDRRKYHDDVSIIIISLEGRIWRSSV